MLETTVTAIQAIQAILAPALGISAVGLLLLSLSNRYSTIINRMRLLNDEKRKFNRELGKSGELSFTDNSRYMSITKQAEELLIRSKLVRNAILSMQTAIALFVLTSAAIALNLFVHTNEFQMVTLFIFVSGMISVFIGILFAAKEVYRSYKIILLEAKAEE